MEKSLDPIETKISDAVLNHLDSAIGKVVRDQLASYNGVISKVVNQVIDKNEGFLRDCIEKGFNAALNHESFRTEIEKAVVMKTSRVLVDKLGGEIDKRVQALRSDPRIRNTIDTFIMNLCESGIPEPTKAKSVTLYVALSIYEASAMVGVPALCDVEFIKPESIQKIVSEMTAGQIDISKDSASFAAARMADNCPVKFKLGYLNHCAMYLYLRTSRTDSDCYEEIDPNM